MQNTNWLSKAVIYHIFIDRFFQGGAHARRNSPPDHKPVFCGGNLQGIAEKMDYLQDLGINAIWLSPFTKTTAYHGYHVTDFYRVEEHFGGERGFATLRKAAKAAGIRLIMDFVPNHVHDTHPWFLEAKKNQRSRYRKWFYWQRNGDYLKFLDVGELPKLNLDHPPARAEIIKIAKYWMDQGIDGFRLDHALGPSLDFWGEFRRQLKQQNEEVALFAEVLFLGFQRQFLATILLPDKRLYYMADQLGFDVLGSTMREYSPMFDGLLDFHFQRLCKKLIARGKKKSPDTQIQEMLDEHYERFPDDCSLLSFLDNHDMNRFLFEAGRDKTKLKRAIELQFKQKSPPIIYYGNEVGMSQSGPVWGHYGDLQARRMMPWQGQDHAIRQIYKRAIQKWKRAQS